MTSLTPPTVQTMRTTRAVLGFRHDTGQKDAAAAHLGRHALEKITVFGQQLAVDLEGNLVVVDRLF